MEAKQIFSYDREGDILHIDKSLPYPEQETEELGDDVLARINPTSGEIENLEVMFFSTRLLRKCNYSISWGIRSYRGLTTVSIACLME